MSPSSLLKPLQKTNITAFTRRAKSAAAKFNEGWRDTSSLITPGKQSTRHHVALLPPKDAVHAALLIPGIFGQTRAMIPLAKRCEKAGIPACVFHVGAKGFLPYAFTRAKLCERIQGIRDACPRLRRLDLVAHSMGGLWALDAITEGAVDGLRVRLVTLGTMYRGTPTAALVPFALSAWQALPWHPRFQKGPPLQMENVPWFSIVSSIDTIVPQKHTRQLNVNHQLVVQTTHAGLLRKQTSLAPAVAFLMQPHTQKAVTSATNEVPFFVNPHL